MGKFGCRLYCWGCGGCCLLTGIIMGILSAIVPSGMLQSCQENVFDLSFIDDTSETDAEGLFADAGAPIAEADAFKAWGKSTQDGLADCLKEDWPFDWSKSETDCLPYIPNWWFFYNATDVDSWGRGKALKLTEHGPMIAPQSQQKIATADATSHWDKTGKARWGHRNIHKKVCDSECARHGEVPILTTNSWYGIYANAGLADGWITGNALNRLQGTTTKFSAILSKYLKNTSAGVGQWVDIQTFYGTPNARKLGNIDVSAQDFPAVFQELKDLTTKTLSSFATNYSVPAHVCPLFFKTRGNAVIGYGKTPYYLDPLSQTGFTFQFATDHTPPATAPAAPAFMEIYQSSIYYHDGLDKMAQHIEVNAGTVPYNASCASDKDCPASGCFKTENCQPFDFTFWAAAGKLPGLYFGSPKGGGAPAQKNGFIGRYFTSVNFKSTGRKVLAVQFKGPDTVEGWVFEGFLAHDTWKTANFIRRLENCDATDKNNQPGWDCNQPKDSTNLTPYFGLPMYFNVLSRSAPPAGWDPALSNAADGPKSFFIQDRVFITEVDSGNHQPLEAGYEPHLGVAVDANIALVIGWRMSISRLWFDQEMQKEDFKYCPDYWVRNPIHLPPAINMGLSKLQALPSALNGFNIFLIGQCMISLVGGFACCFCGA